MAFGKASDMARLASWCRAAWATCFHNLLFKCFAGLRGFPDTRFLVRMINDRPTTTYYCLPWYERATGFERGETTGPAAIRSTNA